VHHPREIIRIERDYASGELAQFATTYPLELEGRVRHIPTVLLFYLLVELFYCADNTDAVLGYHKHDQ
jgi:hypothetical protein